MPGNPYRYPLSGSKILCNKLKRFIIPLDTWQYVNPIDVVASIPNPLVEFGLVRREAVDKLLEIKPNAKFRTSDTYSMY